MCLIYTWEPFSRRTVYQALKTVWYCRSKTLPLWHASIMTLKLQKMVLRSTLLLKGL
jgi:hypothetical protein